MAIRTILLRDIPGHGRTPVRTARHGAAVAVVTSLVLVLAGAAGGAIDDSAAPAQIERVRYSADGTSTRVIIMLSRSVPCSRA